VTGGEWVPEGEKTPNMQEWEDHVREKILM